MPALRSSLKYAPLTAEKQKPPHGGGLVGLSLIVCIP